MKGPGDCAPVEYVPTEDEQAREACSECGQWGPCLDSCPLVVEQAAREAAETGASS